MKKQTHPQLIDTIIQLKDGSVYYKRWNFFRNKLPLDTDISGHFMWKKQKEEVKSKKK